MAAEFSSGIKYEERYAKEEIMTGRMADFGV